MKNINVWIKEVNTILEEAKSGKIDLEKADELIDSADKILEL